MKLAMICPYPVDGDTNKIIGGVQAVAVNMIKGLSGFRDLDIHIVTANFSINKQRSFSFHGINLHIVPLDKRFGNITLYARTRKMLTRKIDELAPDVIHSHMFGYYTLAALNSKYSEKTIVSTHGISDSNWGIRCCLKEKIRRHLQDYIYVCCARRSRRLIINSPFTRVALAGFGKKIIYELKNPISDLFFITDNRFLEDRRILFVGNVSNAKGIDTLLDSMALIKPEFSRLKLIIAGDFQDEGFRRKMFGFIKEHVLNDAVDFLGHISDERLRDEYVKASVFVLPTQQDVAPLAMLQAMAGGKAVVVSRVGGLPYIINDGINGLLIEKRDSKGLAEKLSLLLKDNMLRKTLGDNARKSIGNDYRITNVSKALYSIYREIANV